MSERQRSWTLDTASPLFLGKRAEELSALIEQQIEPIFRRVGLVVPVRSCSLLLELDRSGSASAADLAKALGTSHQLVLQKVPALLAADLVRRDRDPEDRRRRLLTLTPRGEEQIERLLEHSSRIRAVYRSLGEEIGVDLFAAMGRAIEALSTLDLMARLDADSGDDPASEA